jgi:hypothetical protein
MTYGEVKKQVLRLLNQYKIAGSVVASDYNNQDDYIDRIPGLVNDAMMEISTTVRRIEKTVQLDFASPPDSGHVILQGDFYVFAFPTDFFAYKSGDNWLWLDGKPVSHQMFTHLGIKWPGAINAGLNRGHHFVTVPKALADNHEVLVTYYCYPTLLDESTLTDSTDLDSALAPDVLRAIPYYVAGMLALHDDPFLASNLTNAYEDKLAKMAPPPSAEIAPVQDAYGFFWGVGRDYV